VNQTVANHWPYQDPDTPSVAAGHARHASPFDSATNTRRQCVRIVEHADHGVGTIMRALDSLGLAQNTIVIFTNDNGGEWLWRNIPFFHNKSSLWEGGIRVPAIVRWPGHIPAGTISGQVGITIDLTASVLAATSTPIPANAAFDGMDIFPVLEGRAPPIERTLFWRVNGGRRQLAVRSGDWKLIRDQGRPLLYNVRTDLGERDDMVGRRSDIGRRLRPLIEEWRRT
jgi:arylsulfatase A-like enzyme